MEKYQFPSSNHSSFLIVLSKLNLVKILGGFWDPDAGHGHGFGGPIYVIKKRISYGKDAIRT